MGRWALAKLIDPMGSPCWSSCHGVGRRSKRARGSIGLEGSLLWNRLVWLGVAVGVLALTHLRFRFAHHTARGWWSRGVRPNDAPLVQPDCRRAGAHRRGGRPIAAPRVRRAFGVRTQLRQMLAVAWESFRDIVTSWGGLVLAAMTVLLVVHGARDRKTPGHSALPHDRAVHRVPRSVAGSLLHGGPATHRLLCRRIGLAGTGGVV